MDVELSGEKKSNLVIFGTLVTSTELNNLEIVPGYLVIEDGKVSGIGLYYTFFNVTFCKCIMPMLIHLVYLNIFRPNKLFLNFIM